MVHQLITIADEVGPDESVWSVFDRKLETALQAVEVAASVRLRNDMGYGIDLIRWLEGWNLRFKQQGKAMFCIAEDPAQQQCLELSHPNMGLICITSLNDIPKMLLRLTKQINRIGAAPVVVPVRNDLPVERTMVPPPVSLPVQETLPGAVLVTEGRLAQETIADSPKQEPVVSVNSAQPPSPQMPPPQQPQAVRTSPGVLLPTVQITEVNISRTGVVENEYALQPQSAKKVRQDDIIEIAGEYRCDNCGTTRMFCKGIVVDTCENRECYAPRASYTLQFDLF